MFEHSESKPDPRAAWSSSDALSETELARAASFAGPRRASTTNLEQSLQDAGSSSAGSSSPRSRSGVAPATVVERGAGVCIGALLNLMLCVPFALAYFPIEWHPFPVPRAMGCSMYFLSTVLTFHRHRSDDGRELATVRNYQRVPFADGVAGPDDGRKIPFMHAIATVAMEHQGWAKDALGTVLIIWTVGTLFVGAAFFALGYLKVGSIVYHIPRQVIVGCIGGIGIFLSKDVLRGLDGPPVRARPGEASGRSGALSVAYEIGLRDFTALRECNKAHGAFTRPDLLSGYRAHVLPAAVHERRDNPRCARAYFLFPNTPDDVSPSCRWKSWPRPCAAAPSAGARS